MNTNPLTKGVLMENFAGIGTVTPEMVKKRAIELALINGRTADKVSTLDVEQAERELTGGSNLDPREENLEAIADSKFGDPLPGSTGSQVPNSIDDDEDSEGRSIGEQLVGEGVNEAEHDQMLQAARDAEEEDPTEKTER
jgi:hypothetical protein